ncbi:MAG: hypothetical protein J07HQX50_01132 [Haloquadratum sp. J07HQX50]|jgi:hypothetical protein|nr:MAG: hypothetical protein J07HQX50_01132 [Haloquadratum sp. J07HQX50]
MTCGNQHVNICVTTGGLVGELMNDQIALLENEASSLITDKYISGTYDTVKNAVIYVSQEFF